MVTKDCPCQSRTTHLPQQACLLLLHVWRFSDTGCDHITCPASGRHVRERFGKCLVHLANRVPKPGDGRTFGRTLPKRQLGGDTASDPPRATPNKALQPMGPICAKLCYGRENGHLSENRRGTGDAMALLACQEGTELSDPTLRA